MAHKWKPIEDLPSDFDMSADNELRELLEAWDVLKDALDPDELRRFNDELKREWAIETGQIEGAYNLDRGTTETLIKRGIDERWIPHRDGDDPARIAAVLHDHHDVVNGLFDFIKETRGVSTSYIKELHSALMRNQPVAVGVDQFGNKREIPLLRGEYKKRPNNPTTSAGEHEYCPPEHTASEMDRLLEMHEEHVRKDIPPLAEAAWLHHRFVQIHPFQDGNGRVVRCLATLVLIKAGLFPLVVRRGEEREKYLDALQTADNGDLSELVNFFAALQKEFLDTASRIARKIRHETEMGNVVKSAAGKLRQQREVSRQYKKVEIVADNLVAHTRKKLNGVRKQLTEECGAFALSFGIDNQDSEGRSNLNPFATFSGKKFGYYPNTNAYAAWATLSIRAQGNASIYVHFHGMGREYRGVIACSVMFDNINKWQYPAGNVFLINYKEPEEEIKKRFEEWLDKALLAALQLWRDNL